MIGDCIEVSENQLPLDFSSLYQSNTHGKINKVSNDTGVHYLCIFFIINELEVHLFTTKGILCFQLNSSDAFLSESLQTL